MERRLTKKHLDLTQFEKMTVQLAVDVMSEPIGAILNEIDGQAYQGEIVESEGKQTFFYCMVLVHTS